VETHVANLLSKSGASNRMQLVTWARSEAGEPASAGQPERRPR
jgi:DNA-binding NarL/FixJ family response regulator